MISIEKVVLKKKNIEDYALERNILLHESRADWVLFVDSDEKVPQKLKTEIEAAVQSGKFDAYRVRRKNYFLGQYVGTDKIIRLARKNAGKWERRVHEVWKIKGKVGELDNTLIHDTAQNLRDYIDKINKYSTLHAAANRSEGKRSNLLKIIFYPLAKFVQTFVRSGNVVFSIMQSLHSFLSWSKLYFLSS